MKRTETIALYQEEFLAGRSDEAREKFLNKSVEKQYASIKQWLMRNSEKQKVGRGRQNAVSADTLARDLLKAINNGPTMNNRTLTKVRAMLAQAIDAIDNYDRVLAQVELNAKKNALAELAQEESRLAAQKQAVANEIAQLESQING